MSKLFSFTKAFGEGKGDKSKEEKKEKRKSLENTEPLSEEKGGTIRAKTGTIGRKGLFSLISNTSTNGNLY